MHQGKQAVLTGFNGPQIELANICPTYKRDFIGPLIKKTAPMYAQITNRLKPPKTGLLYAKG